MLNTIGYIYTHIIHNARTYTHYTHLLHNAHYKTMWYPLYVHTISQYINTLYQSILCKTKLEYSSNNRCGDNFVAKTGLCAMCNPCCNSREEHERWNSLLLNVSDFSMCMIQIYSNIINIIIVIIVILSNQYWALYSTFELIQ